MDLFCFLQKQMPMQQHSQQRRPLRRARLPHLGTYLYLHLHLQVHLHLRLQRLRAHHRVRQARQARQVRQAATLRHTLPRRPLRPYLLQRTASSESVRRRLPH